MARGGFQMTSRRFPPTLILACVGLGLLIGGCGGGGGQETLSKAEFISRADAICRKTDQALLEKVRNIQRQSSGAGGLPREAVAAVALPAVQREAEELKALPAPKGDAATIDRFVSEIEAGLKKAEKDFSANFTNDRGTFRKVNELGTEFGFNECSEPL